MGRPLRILIVDDEPVLRDFLSRFFVGRGFEVAVETNGPDALERAKAAQFDAMLCDIQMPGLTGVQVVEALRAARSPLAERSVLMTGDRQPPDLPAPCFSKPFPLLDAEALIRRLIGGGTAPGAAARGPLGG